MNIQSFLKKLAPKIGVPEDELLNSWNELSKEMKIEIKIDEKPDESCCCFDKFETNVC